MTSRAEQMLAARRDELNARFARAAGDPAAEAMLAYLRRTVMPILDGWEGEPADAILLALFDVGLAGMRAGLVGVDEASAFEHALRDHVRGLSAHVERAPAIVLRAVGNGFVHVLREAGTAAAVAWLTALAAGAPRCPDRAALFELGVVLGWRAGLADAREVALECAARLDAALLAAVFGGGGGGGGGSGELGAPPDADPERRFCRPGSRAPLGPLALVATTGGFIGFGGAFRSPPVPRVVGGRLVCTDGDATFEVFADVFGARLRPAPWAHADAIASTDAGRADVDALVAAVAHDEVRGAVAAAGATGMIAVTRDDSHKVFVLGRREATP
jgi:hypothetical protein